MNHAKHRRGWLARGCLGLVAILAIIVGGAFLLLVVQGRARPAGEPQYVALGSSFAAGIGLGPRAPGSPFACMRSVNGYPSQLAALRKLSLVDMSCSAATTAHVLHGGQFFQGPQVNVVTARTKLVTITSGGNDVNYVGDLTFAAARHDTSVVGWISRNVMKHPSPPTRSAFDKVRSDLVAVVAQVRRRSPGATTVIVTYPMILPPEGTCARLNLSEPQVIAAREVGERLAEATRAAAADSGALLVDMQRLGAAHHACAASPWVNGWNKAEGTAFHPTLLGAKAIATAIASVLDAHAWRTSVPPFQEEDS